jgi:hypothetical protein
MVLASRGFAQSVGRGAVEADMPLPGLAGDWPRWRRDSIAEGVAQLQTSGALGKARTVARRQPVLPTNEDSATVSRETSGLRMEPSLRTRLSLTGPAVVAPVAPGQALNLEGLVPASRMQVREGVVFLEGDAMVQPKAPSPDHSSMLVVPSVSSDQARRDD